MNPELLGELREQINDVDERITALLAQRALLALRIGDAKGTSEVYDPKREADVIEGAIRMHEGPLPDEAIRAIYEQIIDACRQLQAAARENR